MDEKIIILMNNIRRDLEAIAAIYEELEQHPLQQDTDDDTLIVIAYHLHNLYNEGWTSPDWLRHEHEKA